MITFRQKGDFSKLTRFLEKAKHAVRLSDLDKYGREGVAALASATPVDSGLTATSWYYEITNKNGVIRIEFCNSNVQSGVPIAIILQYGHATGTGGWVEGRDYINPSVRPLFDDVSEDVQPVTAAEPDLVEQAAEEAVISVYVRYAVIHIFIIPCAAENFNGLPCGTAKPPILHRM